jgi:hypothetical protein
MYSTSSSMPVVTAVVLQDSNTLVFTGVGFEFSSFPAQVSFLNVIADSVSVDSDTQVTATYSEGVPLSQSAQTPLLFFQDTDSSATHWAVSTSTVINRVTQTALNS